MELVEYIGMAIISLILGAKLGFELGMKQGFRLGADIEAVLFCKSLKTLSTETNQPNLLTEVKAEYEKSLRALEDSVNNK